MVALQASKLAPPPIEMSTIHLSKAIAQAKYLIHTLYLFTANDFLTFAIPTLFYAVCGALSGPILTTNPSPAILPTALRIPQTLATIWLNLLVFTISNQRLPAGVASDRIDKPHRPIPSGRISPDAARDLLLVLVPLVGAWGWYMDVWQESFLLFAAQWMYNDLQGSESHYLVRNALNAIGYGLYSAIALRVMVGADHVLRPEGLQWIAMVVLLMFTTQQVCDIKDAEGDRLTGRRSAPIVLGDELCRWSVAVPVMLFSAACPALFNLGLGGYVVPLVLGAVVAGRTLAFRNLKADKLTWKLWALWTCSLFVLPVVRNPDAMVMAWRGVAQVFCPTSDCSGGLNVVAVSGVAFVVEGRRFLGQLGQQENHTVPEIRIEGVVA